MPESRSHDSRTPEPASVADWRPIVRARLEPLKLTAAAESTLVDEVAQHLDDLYRELRYGGTSAAEAFAHACAELDDLRPLDASLKPADRRPPIDAIQVGDTRQRRLGADLLRDLRYAARTFRRNPLFAAFVIITLGLGIGANTTVFTIIDTLLLDPLPVDQPSDLVAIGSEQRTAGEQGGTMMPVSYADVADYRAGATVFASTAAYTKLRVLTWQTAGASRQALFGEFVTPNFFDTLGVRMVAGRALSSSVDGRPDAPPVAVMNYGTWQRRFGGAPDIIGRQLRLNTLVVTVIGVARPRFIGVNALVGPDLWMPASLAEPLLPNEMRDVLSDRDKPVFFGVARLKPHETLTHAQANVTAISAALARTFPATNDARRAIVQPIADVLFGGGSRMIFFATTILTAVVAIVLIIACANVASLLLARAAARQHEMAVRLALGASRARLLRQLLTESLCLGLLSGVAGLAISVVGMSLLRGTLPITSVLVSPAPNGRVLVFTGVVSLLTGVMFGFVPALRASRDGLADVLRDGRSVGHSARRVTMANALLVGQVALSFVLLVTSALFLRSLQHAYAIDPGFQSDHLALFIASPEQAGYTDAQTRQFYTDVREHLATVPGVASASWASNLPLFARPETGLQVEGYVPRSQGDTPTTIVNTVDLGYFETAGVRLIHGRGFALADGPTASPVVVVNEKLARDYWPNDDAIGKRLRAPGETMMRAVIGVVRTANYTAWAEPPQRCVYVPLAQHPMGSMTLYVRATADPAAMIGTVERTLAQLAPRVLLAANRTGRQIVDRGLFGARMGVMLLGIFGLLALALASIGLYGNLAYLVQQRTQEIGVRMALGAGSRSVLRLILTRGLTLVVTGVAIGAAVALGVGRLLSRLLFGVSAGDPASLVGSAVTLLVVALLACLLPARRATRVDPLVALRHS